MSNTATSKFYSSNRMEFEAEVDLSAAGAITAVRPRAGTSATVGDGFTATKSSTATYTFVFKGNVHGQKMYAVLNRDADVHGTPATITRAIITSITQATDGSDDITVVVKTTNATFVETATTGACTLKLNFVIQTARMSGPFD